MRTTSQPALQSIDPVCGARLTPAEASASFELGDETHLFCSQRCLNDFMESPEAFLPWDRLLGWAQGSVRGRLELRPSTRRRGGSAP